MFPLSLPVGAAAKQSYTDFDLYNFLTNTECMEAHFDSWLTFGVPLDPALVAGGPARDRRSPRQHQPQAAALRAGDGTGRGGTRQVRKKTAYIG